MTPSGIILPIMATIDPASEWLRLSEHYRRMTDEEILDLAQQSSELTSAAQQALASEIAHRGLKVEAVDPPHAPDPEPSRESAYAEDLALVELCVVWSQSDTVQLERLLDTVGVPFFIGPEKARSADAVTSNFADGLSVKVMRVACPGHNRQCRNTHLQTLHSRTSRTLKYIVPCATQPKSSSRA